VGCGLLAGARPGGDTETEQSFDWDVYSQVYESLGESAVGSVQDLTDAWEWDALMFLPIAPPAPDLPIDVGKNRTVLLIEKNFPRKVLDQLVPVQREAGGRPYIAYPVSVREDIVSRERVVRTADGAELARVKPPKDWDPHFCIREQLDVLDRSGLLSLADDSYVSRG